MIALMEFFNAINEFMDTGGQVLTVIAGVIFIMWLMIFERFVFVWYSYKSLKKHLIASWHNRVDQTSWNAEQIRIALISRGTTKLNRNLALIQSLVVLCPLLGLLGTVTGMIEVFDVMAISGSGNARSMASGVSRATIPTMAGMVGSLSGVFTATWLKRNAKKEAELLADSLTISH
ncbi:MotA/TolQ/ExbB proton channel family protein [Litorilituus lipolyticus]|uniref:MotA/TolQ/ExbB proton channel family protein n=1 Tax=Litorilituus lipolyticus TaxID=2491017 RepID=A0A502KRR9_9GAMM|nr:MotA/TolQ/ExbB proton channel family protein [Litorilituus lipolyticus]TPH14216.1 MotA/TolQ/ExbB proton channel family protein [Litorilituus lipolyticus]